jgi:hypothetical protein
VIESSAQDIAVRCVSSGLSKKTSCGKDRSWGAAALWRLVLALLLLICASPAVAGGPPAMVTAGQMNVSSTGAFTYNIPIAVPPGTAGMVPAISLDYSSQGGDGIVGLGWTLSGLPSITRCPRTLVTDGVHGSVNFDGNDAFCLEGQRLVSVGADSGLCPNGVEYRTEINSLTRVAKCGTAGSGPQYFLAWTKSGQLMEFGNTPDSAPNPVIVGGGTLPEVRSWAVNKITDAAGNYLNVKYVNDETNGQLYPLEIDYTGNTGLTPYNSVRFVIAYRDSGATVPTYQAGTVAQRTVVLTEIDTCTNVGGTCAYASRYYLNYNGAPNRHGFVTQGNQHDELTSVQQCDCLPPTSFVWQGSRDTADDAFIQRRQREHDFPRHGLPDDFACRRLRR